MAPLYLGINFANSFINVYTTKFSSKVFKNETFIGTILTSIISGFIAIIFFSILANFNLSGINLRTVIYAFLFTIKCYFGYVTTLLIYNYLSIIDNMLISGLFGIIMTTTYSTLLFGEVFDLRTLISVILRAVAVFLSFFNAKKIMKKEKKEVVEKKVLLKKGVFLALLIAFVNGLGGILSKSYSLDLISNKVPNTNVYFFLTNVFILIIAVVIFIFCLIFKRKYLICHLSSVNKKAVPILVVKTLTSNISSTLGMLLYTVFPIMVLTPLSATTSIVTACLVSLFFKEKITIFRVLALVVTVLSACVMIIPL